LKMQLHPHFLFNTLNTISVLMLKDVKAAKSMLLRLSNLLRMALDNVGSEEVPLKQELAFLENYLEIERARFQDRLNIEMEVEPDALEAKVPYLILQPLVENAIKHGVLPYSSIGLIKIRAQCRRGMIHLEVFDNGPGIKLQPDHRAEKGIGLANTQAR